MASCLDQDFCFLSNVNQRRYSKLFLVYKYFSVQFRNSCKKQNIDFTGFSHSKHGCLPIWVFWPPNTNANIFDPRMCQLENQQNSDSTRFDNKKHLRLEIFEVTKKFYSWIWPEKVADCTMIMSGAGDIKAWRRQEILRAAASPPLSGSPVRGFKYGSRMAGPAFPRSHMVSRNQQRNHTQNQIWPKNWPTTHMWSSLVCFWLDMDLTEQMLWTKFWD